MPQGEDENKDENKDKDEDEKWFTFLKRFQTINPNRTIFSQFR
jgi:hypothetical protein